MKRTLSSILLFFCMLQCSAQASELLRVSRTESKDIVQFYFTFDTAPEFTTFQSDRRIDIELAQTTRGPSVSLGEPDSDIVKILPRPEKDRFVVSLFFRYRPQHHKLTKSPDGKLVFEVLLGNEYSKSYQNLADRLKGLTVLERTAANSTNPKLISPYAANWMSFFALYESPVTLDVPVKFSSPPFPLIALLPPGGQNNLRVLRPEMIELARQNLWGELGQKLLATIATTTDLETKKLLTLTYGEALSRNGSFADAYRQLYLLKDQYHDEILGTYAEYLLAHLRAVYEDPYVADNEYRLLEPSINKNLPLAPYFLLSQIETALATANYPRLNQLLLKDNIAYPQPIAETVQIRQADYWFVIHQPVKAQAAYQLIGESAVLQTLPSSLANVCSLYYDRNKLPEAAECYETLSPLVVDASIKGLVDYRKNMARLKMTEGDKKSIIDQFSEVADTYAHTPAGFRAAMKRNDLLFLQNKTWGLQAIENYRAIASEANSRPIREEALFKQALTHAIMGDAVMSIQLLQQFLREFLTGDVRISAQALLIDLLPAEIKRLVDKGEYLKALVLAKQNKDLFQNHWIDSTFLFDIAEAYSQIGIYDEAQKLYLYLIGVSPIDQKEDIFPPLLQATYNHGDFPLVEDYAAQYTYTYPDGRHAEEVLFYRLKALVADERLSDALQLLPTPLPDKRSDYELAVTLFFRTDNYEKCAQAARKLEKLKKPLSDREQFMYAESLFKTGKFAEAESAFMGVSNQSDFYGQTLYRLAELAREQKNEEKALSFFRKLVETDKNSLWKQFAVRELQFAKTATRN
ncbi:hypothetical protein FCL47_11820 [Desulfopila sp. IMCC35006]|uniref:tetratricopeptide repeat protein n=1 Tax=Desulfopila sp. IMCC35006 TaxID=2569542 RepID=UPI0010ACCF25|nr:tetratricopeptide repeat protein [Desulfopila sp. IMCC35006]TKB25789.1 hypothetical protein FCL47_11820 [Desulfopila sp. IMCC35006]